MEPYRLNTGVIRVGKELKNQFSYKGISGRVDKIVIKYGYASPGARIEITNNDMETLVNYEGHTDTVLYPRNWNVANQKMTGITSVPMEGGGAFSAERYLIFGELTILFIAQNEEDYIENISILMEGEAPQAEEIGKEGGMVTSSTPGVSNPMFSRRREAIKLYALDCLKKVMSETKKSVNIRKAEENSEDLQDFIMNAVYGKKFDGMSKSISDQIKDRILRDLRLGKPIGETIKYIQNKSDASKMQAEMIARTESQAIRNKAREWAYKQTDPDGEMKYKWIGPRDHRTTEICKAITQRSSKGVTLDELKNIIDEEGKDMAREWTPHINCRHTYVRVK